MTSFNRALLFQILTTSRYNPRFPRFYYVASTAIALFGVALLMVIFFIS